MSRKRAIPTSDYAASTEASPAKKHLNAALANELDALRISQSGTHLFAPPRNVFGAPVASSPFLTATPPPPSTTAADAPLAFNHAFADSLADTGASDSRPSPVPEVETPASSSSSASMEVIDIQTSGVANYRSHDPIFDDVIVEELDDMSGDEQQTENRLVVYRPPVLQPESSSLRSFVPMRERYPLKGAADEWVRQAQHRTLKRKLAVVPWTADTKKWCSTTRCTTTAIPMKWHATEASADAEQTMEVEDIS